MKKHLRIGLFVAFLASAHTARNIGMYVWFYVLFLFTGSLFVSCSEKKEDTQEARIQAIKENLIELHTKEKAFLIAKGAPQLYLRRDEEQEKLPEGKLSEKEFLNLKEKHDASFKTLRALVADGELNNLRAYMDDLKEESDQGVMDKALYCDAIKRLTLKERPHIEKTLGLGSATDQRAAARQVPHDLQAFFMHLFDTEFPKYWRKASPEENKKWYDRTLYFVEEQLRDVDSTARGIYEASQAAQH